jgi:chaperone BCS1
MFMSMYREVETQVEGITPKGGTKLKANQPNGKPPIANPPENPSLSKKDLEVLAERFADELPEDKLSLAAIQGHLLRFKHEPTEAVDNAKVWSEETLKDMEEHQS